MSTDATVTFEGCGGPAASDPQSALVGLRLSLNTPGTAGVVGSCEPYAFRWGIPGSSQQSGTCPTCTDPSRGFRLILAVPTGCYDLLVGASPPRLAAGATAWDGSALTLVGAQWASGGGDPADVLSSTLPSLLSALAFYDGLVALARLIPALIPALTVEDY